MPTDRGPKPRLKTLVRDRYVLRRCLGDPEVPEHSFLSESKSNRICRKCRDRLAKRNRGVSPTHNTTYSVRCV